MNEMTLLRDLGAALDGEALEPPARVRQRVDAAVHGRRPVRTPAMRRGWRLAGAGGLAMLAVTGLLALQTVGVGDHAPPATAEAADVLHRAALAAAAAPALVARPDQFLFAETLQTVERPDAHPIPGPSASTFVIGTPMEPPPDTGVLNRVWWSIDGTRDGLQRFEPDPIGYGDNILYGCREGRQRVHPESTPATAVAGDGTRACTPHRAYQDDLPTDPAAMRRYLYDTYGGSRPDQNVFLEIAYLNTEVYVPPAARAALFEVAAGIPGVRLAGVRSDATGRRGIAVTRDLDQGSEDGLAYMALELLFDPDTYAYLGDRNVIIRDGWGKPLAQPVLVSSTALLRVAVVDQPGQLP
jgi:hypothetical protein